MMPALDASRNFVTVTVCNAAMTPVTILKAVEIAQSVAGRKFKRVMARIRIDKLLAYSDKEAEELW